MNSADRFTITKIEIWPVDIPITDPFVVATGQVVTAQNLFVRMTLGDGTRGYGEIAPFPELSGEDRVSCMAMSEKLAREVLGQSAAHYRQFAKLFQEMAPLHPAVRCGFETAMVDAVCRSAGVPLWAWWGGAEVQERETDITIPITDLDRTRTLAKEWYARGFRTFKMKVGRDVEQDIRRLEVVHRSCPNVEFIVDANQGFSRNEALEFVKGVSQFDGTILLLEQPVPRNDLDSLAALRASLDIPIAADESVRTLSDAKAVVQHQAADFINIKITKSGLVEAREIAAFAQASGVQLMIGGMVETRIAMGCSFSLVLGLGGFQVLDLDTPLLMKHDPVKGGYEYTGPHLQPWRSPGLDMEIGVSEECLIIER